MTIQTRTNSNSLNEIAAESNRGSLLKIGGFIALLLLAYSLVTVLVLIMFGGQPKTAQEGFSLLQNNRLVGLLRLDLLSILVMPLYYVLFFSLYSVLKQTRHDLAKVAVLLGCAGVTLFLATPSAFSFLSLSDKFAVATNEALKSQLLAAGEAILAADMWHGSGALMGGLLIQTGMLLVSMIMLKSPVFGKMTAWLGIVMHGLDLLHILVGFLFPPGGVVLMVIAGPLYLLWFPLLARDFFRMRKE